jgi:hypothetical protein
MGEKLSAPYPSCGEATTGVAQEWPVVVADSFRIHAIGVPRIVAWSMFGVNGMFLAAGVW